MPGYDTDWPADSGEFCPHPSALDIFVCGTYKLEQSQEGQISEATTPTGADEDVEEQCSASTARKQQKRRGKCLLFHAQDEENLCVKSRPVSGVAD